MMHLAVAPAHSSIATASAAAVMIELQSGEELLMKEWLTAA
jgi:hypothetical protein